MAALDDIVGCYPLVPAIVCIVSLINEPNTGVALLIHGYANALRRSLPLTMEKNEFRVRENPVLVKITRHEGLSSRLHTFLLEGDVRFEAVLKVKASVTLVCAHSLPLFTSCAQYLPFKSIPRSLRILLRCNVLERLRSHIKRVGAICRASRFEALLTNLLKACEACIDDIEQFVDFLVRDLRFLFNVPVQA